MAASPSFEHPPAAPRPLVVLKLGGDAVADPDRIARAARYVAARSAHAQLIVVTSARRGVTDHLTGLATQVERALHQDAALTLSFDADRAVASGEIVTASLVSAALTRLGAPARALDAREAGLLGRGAPRATRLTRVRPIRLRRVLDAGIIPVVAGFQAVAHGRIQTLSRGGSDITAVALAAAFGASVCHFLKRDGLCHTDPARDPDAVPVGRTTFRGLNAILATGARVLHPDAARLAERHRVVLRFEPFPEPGPVSEVTDRECPTAA
jgi:aspartate kinase